MAITVRIPTPLQRLTNGHGEVQCAGQTIVELLADLERRYPGVRERLCDEQGKLRRFVNVFVNEEDIRFLQGDQTAVKDGDEVSIIPAIAGGARRLLPLTAALLVAAQAASAAIVQKPASPVQKKAAENTVEPPAAPPCDERKVTSGAPVATSEGFAAYYARTGELAIVDTAARRTLLCQPIGIGWEVGGFQSIPVRADASENALAFVVSGEGQYRYFDVRKGAEVYLATDPQQRVSYLTDAPPASRGTPIQVLQQWKGAGADVTDQAFHEAVSEAVWRDVWGLYAKQSEPAPPVDFRSQIALGFFAGPSVQASGLSLVDLRDEGNVIVARYTLDAAPGKREPASTSPYGLFVVPRTTKPIIVKEGISRGPGGPTKWIVRYKFEPLPPLLAAAPDASLKPAEGRQTPDALRQAPGAGTPDAGQSSPEPESEFPSDDSSDAPVEGADRAL